MTIDELFDAPCWVIDFLPERVPADSPGQYFAVEAFFREGEGLARIRRKQTDVLLKLACYRRLTLAGEDVPAEPGRIETLMRRSRVLLLTGDTLIVSEPEDLYMTVYHPDGALLALIRAIAASEGLFVRPGA